MYTITIYKIINIYNHKYVQYSTKTCQDHPKSPVLVGLGAGGMRAQPVKIYIYIYIYNTYIYIHIQLITI